MSPIESMLERLCDNTRDIVRMEQTLETLQKLPVDTVSETISRGEAVLKQYHTLKGEMIRAILTNTK